MKIYLDSDFKCHTTNMDGTYREVETDCFYDKCDAFIEGYRFVPGGESWTRSDGVVFDGEMAVPWKDISKLEDAQKQDERKRLEEYTEYLRILGVEV